MDIKFKNENLVSQIRETFTSYDDTENKLTIVLKDEEFEIPKVLTFFLGTTLRNLIRMTPEATHIICPDFESYIFDKFIALSLQGYVDCKTVEAYESVKSCAYDVFGLNKKDATHASDDDKNSDKRYLQSIPKTEKIDRLRCRYCLSKFFQPYNCDRHEKICDKNVNRSDKIPCSLCPTKVKTKSGLQTHMKAKHQSKQLFTCLKCKKNYKNIGDLRRHCYNNKGHDFPLSVTSNKNDNPKSLRKECPTCHLQIFKSKYEDHIKQHKDQMLFKCQVKDCKFSCTRKDNLRRHEKLKHSIHNLNTKPLKKFINKKTNYGYLCPLCAKKFYLPKEIENHMKLKKCQELLCTFCDKKFTIYSNLSRHLKKFHP